jgi:hypothetical protein
MGDKDKKKEQGGSGKKKGGGGGGGNVFDQGNELLLEHAEAARVELQAVEEIPPGSSMLDRAEKTFEEEKEKRESEDEAAQAALRSEAVLARDKVIALMQQMMTNPDEMQALASIPDRGAAATQILETLAPMLTDAELDALAAYDHDDMTYRMIIDAETYQEVKQLSAEALKFGAFGTVLWQLAFEELAKVSIATKKKDEEEDSFHTEGVQSAMMSMIAFMRMVRSSDRL